ncbi:MAG: ABC transporter permease, partial [Pseudohongiellaceae bacterium]
MFKPVSLFVGLRYTRTRKRNHIISFVSVISMLGISLGVLSLVLVLSVINGSTSTMRGETLKSVPHVTLSGEGGLTQWRNLAEEVTRHSQVLAAAPYVEGEAWLRYQGQDQVVTLRGVSPTLETSAVDVANPQFDRLLEQLQTTPNGIILGSRLAGNLGMFNGETLRITPLQSLLGLNLEDAGSFTVLGYADFGFYGNASVALVNLEAAEDFFGSSRSADIRLRLRVTDVFNAGPIAEEAVATMAIQDPGGLTITSWSESQANLFNALRMEKILTGFMLLMIVIIGAVNIVST